MSTLLESLEELAVKWKDRNDTVFWKCEEELRTIIADERKRREPVRMPVSRLEPVDYGEPIDDTDSRIVHGEPVESEAERVIARHNAKMAKVPSLNQRPKSVGEGLRFLAQWFDAMYPDDQEHAVQDDLRRWAADADADPRDALLSQAREALGMGNQFALADTGECNDEITAAIAAIDKYKEATK
ncbi:MAG: hypothetical protein WC455_13435 [Dehalococcoidia bacterium]